MCFGSFVAAVRMSLCVDVIVKSFAYDTVNIDRSEGSIMHVDVKQCTLGKLLVLDDLQLNVPKRYR